MFCIFDFEHINEDHKGLVEIVSVLDSGTEYQILNGARLHGKLYTTCVFMNCLQPIPNI